MTSSRHMIGATMALALVMGCGDGAGPDGVDLADVSFGLQRSDGGSALLGDALLSSTGGTAAAIAPDTVASLTITIESIQALPLLNGENEDDPDAWVTVELDAPVTIDLRTLPTTDESPLILASGSLAEGGYISVRLFISDATIVFKGPLSLGAAITFEGNIEHAVTVPSADQTGIKTNMAFNVLADTDVTLVFDEGASYSNVTLTGAGDVILAPVIRGSGSTGS